MSLVLVLVLCYDTLDAVVVVEVRNLIISVKLNVSHIVIGHDLY